MATSAPRVDVIIIGGGLSGIGAACHLRMNMPHLTYVVLESRENLGGTWDHYKYPGVRTDSDMFTMAFSFNPWKDNKSTASAACVNEYLVESAEKHEVTKHVRFNERAKKASWSSADNTWTVLSQNTNGKLTNFTGSFILMCAGYTNFNHIHKADLPEMDKYHGIIAHPQSWPADLDYKDKTVLVIGSGATAITIAPALAEQAKQVTMLQRSPTYIVQVPRVDPWARFFYKYLPESWAYALMRVKNTFEQQYYYYLSRLANKQMSTAIIDMLKSQLRDGYDVKKHFSPTYPVLTQRLCISPGTVFTKAINEGRINVVTDTIERFTKDGVLLASGEELRADIVVTATGFDLYALGGVQIEIDGVLQENAATSCLYKGTLLCGIPNMVVALGYLTASWTLRVDMIWAYTCRLLAYMQSRGYRSFCPRPPPKDMPLSSIFKIFNSTYLTRGAKQFYTQGTKYPYSVNTSYYLDYWTFNYGTLHDEWIDMK